MNGLRLRIVFVAGVASMMPVTEGSAQVPGVRVGEEVRIRSETAMGRYTVTAVNDGALTLSDAEGSVIRVPAGAITRLDRSLGPRSTGRGALRGLGIGFGVGAVSGALLGFADGDDSGGILSFTAEEKAGMGAIFFGGIGGLLGAGIGAAMPGQQWERVPLADAGHVGVTRDGGVAVSYTLRF